METLLLEGLTNQESKKKSNKEEKHDNEEEEEDYEEGDDIKSKCTSKFLRMFYDIHTQLPSDTDGIRFLGLTFCNIEVFLSSRSFRHLTEKIHVSGENVYKTVQREKKQYFVQEKQVTSL